MARGDNTEVLFVRVPPELLARLDAYVADEDTDRSRATRKLLDKALGQIERRAARNG
jgi:metal-responsive CopG/Arc/MetJ family transcriptional regulator